MAIHLWLRSEEKPGEQRMALTPAAASSLLEAGFRITVEDSPSGCFPVSEFEAGGCQAAAAGSWRQAPDDVIVLGLKELPEEALPLRHRHIHFAHVYKHQQGWQQVLSRFADGGGTLYDLEYLVDDQGRRVAAFGYWAGYAGCALALLDRAARLSTGSALPGPLSSWSDRDALLGDVRQALEGLPQSRVHVIGALGRSGRGAVELAQQAGADIVAWDLAETRDGGPFPALLASDVLVNCVFVSGPTAPFVTEAMLQESGRRLQVISDVSCDPYGDYNPLPVYQRATTLAEPVLSLTLDPPLDIISIDHLPSLLPRESSEDFVEQLLPSLLALIDIESGVWARAKHLFEQKLQEAGC